MTQNYYVNWTETSISHAGHRVYKNYTSDNMSHEDAKRLQGKLLKRADVVNASVHKKIGLLGA